MSKRGNNQKSTTIIVERRNNQITMRNSDGLEISWPRVGADTMLLGMIYQTLRSRLDVLESFSNEICIELSIKEKWII